MSDFLVGILIGLVLCSIVLGCWGWIFDDKGNEKEQGEE
jgi:hypothetical protein